MSQYNELEYDTICGVGLEDGRFSSILFPAILAFQTKVLRTLLQYRQNIEAKDCLS